MKFVKEGLLELRNRNNELQELFDLRDLNENQSIVEQLCIMAEQRIDTGPLSEFRKMYMPRGLCEARFMKNEKKHKRVQEETRFLNEERKKVEEKMLELPRIFVDKEAYNVEKQLFAYKKDIKDLS